MAKKKDGTGEMGKPGKSEIDEREFLRRIVVKFRDDIDLPYTDSVEEYFQGDMLAQWNRLVSTFPGITLNRLYTTISPNRILELVERARNLDRTYEPPNFLTYFVINVPLDSDPNKLTDALSYWEAIQYAYIESLPAPLPTAPTGLNPELGDQNYLDPPDLDLSSLNGNIGGIDARYAWNLPGGSGEGVTFVDIEKSWVLDHDDLVDPSLPSSANVRTEHLPLLSGAGTMAAIMHCDPGELDCMAHGTRVLGVLAAQDNDIGCVGIACKATAKVLSPWEPPSTTPTWNIPDAIMTAANNLKFGDVILLELQVCQTETGGACPAGLPEAEKVYVPVELEAANYANIRLATALGIVVVEAAGNGAKDLSTRIDSNGEHIFDPASSEKRDSGAIIVGAAVGRGPNTLRRKRHSTSNYGDRVNCYAWGNQVTTTSDPAEDPSGYTSNFTGTSAASAIVAGAAILVQAIVEKNPSIGFRFSPFQLRDILGDTSTGTPSADCSTYKIGVMPNLRAIIDDTLNLTPDVYVRDHIGDDGDPHTNSISASPDVIVRPATGSGSVVDYNATFGGSATINDNNLSLPVTVGQDHMVYVRVLNRGGALATEVKATVYYAELSTLPSPDSWIKIGASVGGCDVPISTGSLTVLDPIPWLAAGLSGSEHYCFIATIGSNEDPDPVPDYRDLTQMELDDFRDFIRRNNNVTWRNFSLVPIPPGTGVAAEMPFTVSGWPSNDIPMQIEVVTRLPDGARVWLEGPLDFIEAIVYSRRYLEKDKKPGVVRLPINPHGANRFRQIVFPAKLRANMRLLIHIPEREQRNAYDIFARQLYRGKEVGRVTWRLIPLDRMKSPK